MEGMQETCLHRQHCLYAGYIVLGIRDSLVYRVMATLLGEQARRRKRVHTAFIGAILADFSVILSTDSRLLSSAIAA